VFLPLLSIAVCTLLFLFSSRFRLYCNLQFKTRRAFLFAYLYIREYVVVSFVANIFCHCAQQLLYIILELYIWAFSLFSGFSVFFTDQQNETLRRDAS